jgi:hypothetical protein
MDIFVYAFFAFWGAVAGLLSFILIVWLLAALLLPKRRGS